VIRVARIVAIALMVGVLGAQRVQAQYGPGYGPFWQRPIHLGIDVGGSVPTGRFADNFQPGWDVGGNLAVPLTPHGGIWLQGDFNYAAQNMEPSIAAAYGANAGRASVTSGTLNLVLNKRDYLGRVTPYLLIGGGAYWRNVQLDDYAGLGYCNDYVGYCGVYGVAVPVRTRTQLAPGFDGGGGFRFRLRPVHVFLEVRYNSVYTRHGNTAYLPIVLGTEW
jgi:hypothetical protein